MLGSWDGKATMGTLHIGHTRARLSCTWVLLQLWDSYLSISNNNNNNNNNESIPNYGTISGRLENENNENEDDTTRVATAPEVSNTRPVSIRIIFLFYFYYLYYLFLFSFYLFCIFYCIFAFYLHIFLLFSILLYLSKLFCRGQNILYFISHTRTIHFSHVGIINCLLITCKNVGCLFLLVCPFWCYCKMVFCSLQLEVS